jgi:hypothetical protein
MRMNRLPIAFLGIAVLHAGAGERAFVPTAAYSWIDLTPCVR